MEVDNQQGLVDSGLCALVVVAKLHQIPIQPQQLQHIFGKPDGVFGDQEILRAANALDFSAKRVNLSGKVPDFRVLPAIGQSNDGKYVVVAKAKSPATQGRDEPTAGSEPAFAQHARRLCR